jgi:hypothetical protein
MSGAPQPIELRMNMNMNKSVSLWSCATSFVATALTRSMIAILGATGTGLVGCNENADTIDDALQNGKAIGINESGIRLVTDVVASDGCTAALVGRRMLLTAAHCVADMTPKVTGVRETYLSNKTIRISKPGALAGKWEDNASFDTYVVNQTKISTGWVGVNPKFQSDPKAPCSGTDCLNFLGHDVAFVSTTTDIDGTVLPISLEAFDDDAPVTIYGGGRLSPAASRDDFSLRKGVTTMLSRAYWVRFSQDKNPQFANHGITMLAQFDSGNFLMTAGSRLRDATTPNALKGDSGGAIVVLGRIVGVNSLGQPPFYQAHAPLAGLHAEWVRETLCPAPEKPFSEAAGTCSMAN